MELSRLSNEWVSSYKAKGAEFIGVAIPGTSSSEIDTFKQSNGIEFGFWTDANTNWPKLVPPGGTDFPIVVIIDRDGIVRFLSNDYAGDDAMKALDEALK